MFICVVCLSFFQVLILFILSIFNPWEVTRSMIFSEVENRETRKEQKQVGIQKRAVNGNNKQFNQS